MVCIAAWVAANGLCWEDIVKGIGATTDVVIIADVSAVVGAVTEVMFVGGTVTEVVVVEGTVTKIVVIGGTEVDVNNVGLSRSPEVLLPTVEWLECPEPCARPPWV